MGSRIGIRLDDALARQLDEIRAITNESTTEVVRSAIALYRASLGSGRRRAADVLSATGFIGVGAARADLSATYKAELTRNLGAKIRPSSKRRKGR